MQNIYLLVGSPGVGKTWVTSQIDHSFKVIEHDDYKSLPKYVNALSQAAIAYERPIIANTPFGVSEIISTLFSKGIKCIPLFIIEDENVLRQRYVSREGKNIPAGHITRQKTYAQRAQDLNAFKGTSAEILAYLKSVAIE